MGCLFRTIAGESSTAMRWHQLEIPAAQWCKTGSELPKGFMLPFYDRRFSLSHKTG